MNASKCWCRSATRCCASACSTRFLEPTLRITARRGYCSATRLMSATWQSVQGKRDRRPPIGAAAFSAQDVPDGRGGRKDLPRCCPPRRLRQGVEWLWEGNDNPMILYFLRHASAGEHVTNPKKDEKRALDKEGIEQCGFVGRALAALNAQVDAIVSSPLKRCTQTASLVGNELGYEGKLQIDAGFASGGGACRLPQAS